MNKSIFRVIAGFMAFLLFFYSIDISAFAQGKAIYDIDVNESVSAAAITEKTDEDKNEDSLSENDTTSLSENDIEIEDDISKNEVSVPEKELTEIATDEVTYERTYIGDGYNISFVITAAWNSGYNVIVNIENTSDVKIHNWSIAFDYVNEINNIWDACIVGDENGKYIVKNNGWNQDIEAGGMISFGFSCKESFGYLPSNCELIGNNCKLQDEAYSIWYELIGDWGDGYQAAIFIKNNSDTTIEDWALEFDYARDITTVWNADVVAHYDNHYALCNKGHNANIAPGETKTIGFLGINGVFEDEPYNYILSSYTLDEMEYVQLSDGIIEKDYYEQVILPNIALYDIDTTDIKLSDDYDGDGLSLNDEYAYDTNPFAYDTDEDGLSDYEEIYEYSTNPTLYDTDNDGMWDGTEVDCGLNPLEADSDKDGVKDDEELTIQSVRLYGLFNYSLGREQTLPSLKVKGYGDYSQQINVVKEESDAIYSIGCVKGTAYDFVHRDDLSFQEATISYEISNDILSEYELSDLVIAYYDKNTNELQLLETITDSSNNILSANVSHLSTYCVVSASEFFYELEMNNYGAKIESGKADIVFAIDTTGSMSGPINNVKNNISSFANALEENAVDARLGLVDYKDITFDGIDTTVNHGWYTNPAQFKNELGTLEIKGGGDDPESAVDAIYVASRMNYRNGANRYIILVTDAGYKDGIKGNPDISLNNVLVPFDNDYVSVSLVAREGFFSHYSEIVDATNGIYADIYSDFSIVLEQFITKISTEVNDKYWIRLANGTVVALDADPHLGDTSIDTDGDGLADIYELKEPIVMKGYNPKTASYVEYEAWTFVSNPTMEDTDGDSVCDTIDLYPTTYDSVVVSEDEECIVFNSGRAWNKIRSDVETFVHDKLHDGNESLNANHVISSGYDKTKENVLKNEKQDFSFDELCYIGVDDNEGSKIYLHLKTSELRENIFKTLSGRESKWYIHRGYLITDGWEEVPAGTVGGYWKGIVLTEADLNFTYRQYIEEDATAFYTMFKRIGALIILTLFWEFAPEYLVAEGTTGAVVSNIGMASASTLAELTAGSVLLLLSAPELINLTQESVKELSKLKVDSLNITDAAEIEKVQAIVYDAMAADMLDSKAIQAPSNTVGMTDEEICGILERVEVELQNAIADLKLSGTQLGKIITAVVGINKTNGRVAVGIKCNFTSFGIEMEEYLTDQLAYDVMIEGDDYVTNNPWFEKNAIKSVKLCAEDLCVIQLGGMSAIENGEIIMGQAYRFKIIGQNEIKAEEVPVCEACEEVYGRQSFASYVKFRSDGF